MVYDKFVREFWETFPGFSLFSEHNFTCIYDLHLLFYVSFINTLISFAYNVACTIPNLIPIITRIIYYPENNYSPLLKFSSIKEIRKKSLIFLSKEWSDLRKDNTFGVAGIKQHRIN
jgi:hypothetical protein